MSIQNKV